MKILQNTCPGRLLLILLLVLLTVSSLFAQHCPFDGRHLIVIELINASGQPVANAAGNLRLREINQPTPALCTYAEGILNKPLLAPVDVFNSYNYYKPSALTDDFCRGCTFLAPGYYAVNLDQAEETCLIKNGLNSFAYRKREFEVQYVSGITTQTVKIPEDRVYSLCTAQGKWLRIVPVKLKLKD